MKIREIKISDTFSQAEKDAIEEKLELLQRYANGLATLEELAELNTKRRLEWLEKNKHLLDDYDHLSLPEKAHRLLYLEHMKINPVHSIVENISGNKIRIESHNFCPYMEASKILGLDTRLICKEFGEPSCSEFVKVIDPSLKFYRDYSKIRPYHDYCEEFIELIQ